ncbi:MAG: RlmE family RNA methyltransferase [Euryarchaeota archaeon]|nr:RlmE family RNA methyltransferase [Euryarchaeota archaeon]MDE1836019.1 RlmE family RNA methyltransferase [Euryarchaeota archaeon]MDE1882048.1 RlmE family RNA methyltransferase [Euryarchaeota archaeon]MDE2046395.1 RlmE family RNA methyltransferase [Thermoplasmata archaeon]
MTPRWAAERRRDPYYRAAQREGLRSRAAFKLLFLQDRFHLLRPGQRILDLGASPGGWSLVARDLAGRQGEVVSVDLRAFEPIDGVTFIRGRVGDPRVIERLGKEPFDVCLSDMAPSVSGNYDVDHARSVELAELALGLAEKVLRPGGSIAVKVFQGDLTEELRRKMGTLFERVDATKPPASRDASSEMYLIGRRFRGARAPVGAPSEEPSPPSPAEDRNAA